MDSERFDFLLQQYKTGALTQTEWDELRAALATGDFDERLSLDFAALLQEAKTHPSWSKETESAIWSKIHGEMIQRETAAPEIPVIPIQRGRTGRIWWAAAAAVIILIGISTYVYLKPIKAKQSFPVAKVQDPNFKNDVLPGVNKAVLTLAGGKTIVLDSAATGLLAQQGSSQIQNQNGSLKYIASSPSTEIIYNTLTTNRGEQFPLTLSDGTKVWLNASSSIRYPVAFNTGDHTIVDREVEITGEAYFEVTHDNKHPFHVKVNGMDVEDLGTHFNINAYPNEGSINTTLLEGSISVKGSTNVNNRQILKPGQQAQYNSASEIKIINDADAEGAIAWKNGQFHFAKVDITTIMRQIERWYDLEVIYDGAKTTDKFTGDIPRTATLTELLSILQMARVHFKLEGNKLTVMP